MESTKLTNRKIIFLYDSLMNPNTQQLVRIPLHFLSYGYIRAKMYWLNDDKKRRYFAVPLTKQVHCREYNTYIFGALYLMTDYDEYKNALFSFYNSSLEYYNYIQDTDLYVPVICAVTPIEFSSLKDFDVCKYEKFDKLNAMTMMGNQFNDKVRKSIDKGRYYRYNRGIDVPSFLTSLEKHNGRKQNTIL